MNSIIAFLTTTILISLILLYVGINFFATLILLIYSGALTILFLFVIMLFDFGVKKKKNIVSVTDVLSTVLTYLVLVLVYSVLCFLLTSCVDEILEIFNSKGHTLVDSFNFDADFFSLHNLASVYSTYVNILPGIGLILLFVLVFILKNLENYLVSHTRRTDTIDNRSRITLVGVIKVILLLLIIACIYGSAYVILMTYL